MAEHHSKACLFNAMDSWIRKAPAVLQLFCLLLHLTSAENLAEKSFAFRNNEQDGNLYSVRYDLTDEYGTKPLNNLPKSHPFHEVYSLKGKDGEIQRIHYATDDKGVRANFHSNSINLPRNYMSGAPQTPLMWPAGSRIDKPSFANNNPVFLPNMMQLGYISSVESENGIDSKAFPATFKLVNSLKVSEKGESIKNENPETRKLSDKLFITSNPFSRVSNAPGTSAVYPVNSNWQIATPGKRQETVTGSNPVIISAKPKIVKEEAPVVLNDNLNVLKGDVKISPSELYENTVKDLLRIAKPPQVSKPLQASTTKIDKEKQMQDINSKFSNTVFDYEAPQTLPLSLNAAKNHLPTSRNLPTYKQINITAENYYEPNKPTENASRLFSVKSKKMTPLKKPQESASKVFAAVSGKQKTKMSIKKVKPSLTLEKMSSPMSTVFDISTNNGHYYHYILNMVKPAIKSSSIRGKYYTSGNALLQLLNETGITYKNEDFEFLNAGNVSIQNKKEVDTSSNVIHFKDNHKPTTETPVYLDTANSSNNISEYKHVQTDKFQKASNDESLILNELINDLKIETTTEQFTTEYSVEFSSPTTTEVPSTTNIETTTHSELLDLYEDNETKSNHSIESTETPIRNNITEEMSPLFITMPKSPLKIMLIPVNWLFTPNSENNKTEIATDVSTSFISTSTETTVEEYMESTTSNPEVYVEKNNTELNDINLLDNQTTTTTSVPTTLELFATSMIVKTLKSEKTTITEPTTDSPFEKTTMPNVAFNPTENSDELSSANDKNSTISNEEEYINETTNLLIVSDNSTSVSDMGYNTVVTTEVPAESSVLVTGNQTLNPSNQMIIIQVADMKEFMSHVNNLSPNVTTNTKQKEHYSENKTEVTKIPHEAVTHLDNMTTIYKDVYMSSPMASQHSFKKELPEVKSSAQNKEKNDIKSDSLQTEYTLIYPGLLENGPTRFLQFSPNGMQDISEMYSSFSEDHYSPNSKSEIIELIVGNKDFNSKENEIYQIPTNSDQLQQIVSKADNYMQIKESNNPLSRVTLNSNNNKDTVQTERFSLMNDMISHYPYQNNGHILKAMEAIEPNTATNNEGNTIQAEGFSPINDMISYSPYENNPQLSEAIKAIEQNVAIGNEGNIITNYFREYPSVYSEVSRIPDEGQMIREISQNGSRLEENDHDLLDLTYGDAYIDIPRINGSIADESLIPEIEFVEYVPAESFRSNFQANSMTDDTNNLYLQDPVYILEEYSEVPSYGQQINVNNVIDENPINPNNQVSPSNPSEQFSILLLQDSSPSFGTRLPQQRQTDNIANQQSNDQFNNFEGSASLSRAPWMN